jgi:hypothetical protein
MPFVFSGVDASVRGDHRLKFVIDASQALFDVNKSTADRDLDAALAPVVDGYPQVLPQTDPARAAAYSVHGRALRQAESRHRARIAMFEQEILGQPLPVDVMGTQMAPTYTPEEAQEARQWLQTLDLPTFGPVVQQQEVDPWSDVVSTLMGAYLRDPQAFKSLFDGVAK